MTTSESTTAMAAPAPGPVPVAVGGGEAPLRQALRTVMHRPMAWISVGWLVLVFVVSGFASTFSPDDPLAQNILSALQTPSSSYLLGTDDIGRDILSRLMYGGGGLLITSFEAVVVAVVIGVPLGMVAGYVGHRFDSISSFAFNVLLSIPGFVILVAIVVASGNRLWIVMAVLGGLFSANFYRLVRASTQASRELPYVDAAKVAGLSRGRILSRHILPNVTGPLVVQAFLTFSIGLIIACSLSFLGLGVSPEKPSWGQMIYVATQNLSTDAWMMVPVGAVVIFTVLALNFLGSAIRDALPSAQRVRLLTSLHPRRRPAPESVALAPAHDVELSRAAAGQMNDVQLLLEVDALTVSFPAPYGEQTVVDAVSFGVPQGQTLGLVGESGCGKTMTALALLGLVPPPGQISGGGILLKGQDISVLSERQRGALRGTTIALVSQEPMVALDPCFTIGSLLKEPLRAHRGMSSKEADAEVLNLLRLVGIARPDVVAKSYPHQISGGMAQRVGIAMALTGEPDLLIADEPTTALDVTIQAEILDLLRSLQETLGMTIVLVTHDLGVVADICSTVAVMYAGQVVEMGSVDDVLDRPAHPYTRGLLGASPDLVSPGQPLPTVKGTVPLPKNWPTHCRFADRCPLAIDACRAAPIALELPEPGRVSRCIRTGDMLAGPLTGARS